MICIFGKKITKRWHCLKNLVKILFFLAKDLPKLLTSFIFEGVGDSVATGPMVTVLMVLYCTIWLRILVAPSTLLTTNLQKQNHWFELPKIIINFKEWGKMLISNGFLLQVVQKYCIFLFSLTTHLHDQDEQIIITKIMFCNF